MTAPAFADDHTLNWGHAVRDVHLLEAERVKLLPEFQSWAREQTSGRSTDLEPVPTWTLEECAQKWVADNGVDVPDCPIPSPTWSQAREITMDGDSEIRVRDSAVVTAGSVNLTIAHEFSLVLDTHEWPDGSHVDSAGELFTDDGALVMSGKLLEIPDATPAMLRDYSAALALAADLLETSSQ